MKTSRIASHVVSAAAFVSAVALAATAAAQQPRIVNGRVTTQPAGTPFAQSFRGLVAADAEVHWIGYSVPVVAGDNSSSCWGDGTIVVGDGAACCGPRRLEPTEPGGTTTNRTPAAPVAPAIPIQLEASTRMVVLYRIADKRVERVRTYSEECPLDAGGRAVVWLDAVRPADSIALLESMATAVPADTRDRIAEQSIGALARHRDPAADPALDRLIAPAQPEAIRKKVTFWLGNARGQHGLDTLTRVLRDDPSDEVRKSAVFGVSQSRERGAFDTLASLARTDKSDRIRSEGLFWMAQRGDDRAVPVILDALAKDPAPEVRKKAVFALSQLKEDKGVPALVQVARTHDNAAVRGEAIFWLGQKAGRKASEAITERIEQDPDTEVKKKAVFALSQMPKDDGVPLLINVARNNPNPAVRKQAMFWLGQSKDARAIAFFAEVLGK